MSHSVERISAVAGDMYPSEPAALTRALSELFASVKRRTFSQPPLVLIAPHSALGKSGKVAAAAYASLLGLSYDAVVVIAPSHSGHFPGVSVITGESYVTPLGPIPIAGEFGSSLIELSPTIIDSSLISAAGDKTGEFSLEMALPFLQMALGSFPLVPIITGDLEIKSARALGDSLYSVLRRANPLIVVSTDLSHFHGGDKATALDELTKSTVLSLDAERLMNLFQAGKVEACGMIGLISALIFAQRVGTDEITETDYVQSQVSEGEVIGHTGIVITRSARSSGYTSPHEREMSEQTAFTEDEALALKSAVREAVAARLRTGSSNSPVDVSAAAGKSRRLKEKCGVFVSVYRESKLVGRAGFLRSSQALISAAREVACAAFFDSELIPESTGVDDLGQYDFRIHALSPLQRVADYKTVDPVKMGLLVKIELNSAYLFPDEAPDVGKGAASPAIQALEKVCLKAHLPRNAYQDRLAEIYQFDIETIP